MKSLADLYATVGSASDKGNHHSYIEAYDDLFTPYRTKSINLVEIGVFHGASLHMWLHYFTDATVWGVDFNPDIHPDEVLYFNDHNVYPLLRRDAYIPETIDLLLEVTEQKGFDIIIDDGSHIEEQQIFVLQEYGKLLKPGGILIIEDVCFSPPTGHPGIVYNFTEVMSTVDYEYSKYELMDRRHICNRYDDMLFVVWK